MHFVEKSLEKCSQRILICFLELSEDDFHEFSIVDKKGTLEALPKVVLHFGKRILLASA